MESIVKESDYHPTKSKQLLDEREAARKAKDWAQSDSLRERLRELGFEVQDTKL